MLRSIGLISCRFEEVVALFFLEEVADLADGFPELVVGSGCGFSDQGLELGEYEGMNAIGPRECPNDFDRVQSLPRCLPRRKQG